MADIGRMCAAPRLLVLLGAFLMTAVTVAQAQEPVATAVPTATATATPTVEATPTAEVTPAPTLTATPVATATVTPAPPAEATPAPTPQAEVRQDATPTPTPGVSPTATPEFTGASLTVCHYTGTAGQPYTPAVIDAGAFDAHFDHELDVIPAPPGGCDSITDPDRAHDAPVFVCHATGDPDRPFTLAGQFEPGDLGGHEGHAGDIIPAPHRTCPGLGFYAVPTATPSPTAEPTATPTEGPGSEDDGDRAGAGEGDGAQLGDTLPTFSGVMVTSAPTTAISAQQLPFTGLDLWLIAATGLAMTMAGLGLRLLAQPPDVGVTR